jgi:type I restriction enzyme S subunit
VKSIRLGEVAKIYNGNSINERVKAQNFMGLSEGTPYIATKDISYTFQVDYENGVKIPESNSSEFKLARKGSVLLCAEGGSAGRKMAIIDRDIFFVNKLFCFESSDQLDSKYLFYYLQAPTFQDLFKNSITGLIGGVSLAKVRNLPITLPSKLKQLEIVEKLDSAFAEIDLLEEIHTRSNKELLANLFGTYRDSLLTSACAGSSLVEFGEIGEFVRGPFGGSLTKSMFKESGVAVYEQQHAIYNTFQSFRYFVDDNKFQEMKRFEVKSNDLIMSCSGTYGKIAVVPEGSPKGIINQALLKITPITGVRSQFVKHWMQSSLFQLELEKEVGGAALQNVPSVAKMKSIKIRLPSERIQIETIEKLDEFQSEIELATLTQESIKSNYIALRESLLSNAFTQEEAVA